MFELKRPFSRNLAVVIGINDYENVTPLGTAVNDAKKLADILRSQPEPHNYEIVPLEFEAQPGIDSLKNLLDITLPNVIKPTNQDRLLFYFAGHGYPADSVVGPAGYLVPRDAKPGEMESFLSMEYLHDALSNLDCRHLLIILDCCFAGSFRWAVTRHIAAPTVMYKERFERYTKNDAWQVITSAAHDQKAFDVLFDNRVKRVKEDEKHLKEGVEHSPFAEALFEALEKGTADVNGDGIVTATELYLHLSETLRDRTLELRQQQVPGLWPLKKHDKGEFIFILNKDFNPKDLADAPPIDPENNPYRGLESFETKQSNLFFGRDELIKELYERIALPDAKTNSDRPFTVVLGISGSGKSSLVKAGLIPHLNKQEAGLWQILEPMRPGTTPFLALAKAILPIANDSVSSQDSIEQLSQLLQNNQIQFSQTIAAWHELDRNQGKKLLLVIDQFEELITQSQSSQIQQSQDSVEQKSEWQKFLDVLALAIQAHAQHLRIVVTLRSDFEPRFLNSAFKEYWAKARFPVRAMRADELRQAIEKPAEEKALFFKDPKLVDKLIEEVGQMPGALPLLSFTLSELYIQLTNKNRGKGDTDRALTRDDDKFGQEGGIAGSLTRRANEVYEQIGEVENLGEAAQKTMRRVLLRMLTLEGGETTRRKVPKSELVYPTLEENERVTQVVNSLVDARLLVTGQLETGESYIEPAHDFLVRGWDKLQEWREDDLENLALRQHLTPSINEWSKDPRNISILWSEAERINPIAKLLAPKDSWLNERERKFIEASLRRAKERIAREELPMKAALVENLLLVGKTKNALRDDFIYNFADILERVFEIAEQNLDDLPQEISIRIKKVIYEVMEMTQCDSTVKAKLDKLRFEYSLERSGGRSARSQEFIFKNQPKNWDVKNAFIGRFILGEEYTNELLRKIFNHDNDFIARYIGPTYLPHYMSAGIDKPLSEAISQNGKFIVKLVSRHGIAQVQTSDGVPISEEFSVYQTTMYGKHENLAYDQDGLDRLYNAVRGQISETGLSGFSFGFSPNNKTLIFHCWDGNAGLWDTKGHKYGLPLRPFTPPDARYRARLGKQPPSWRGPYITSFAFSHNGQMIVTGSSDGNIYLRNLENNEPSQYNDIEFAQVDSVSIQALAFSPDDQTIASATNDETHLWDIRGNRIISLNHETIAAEKSTISLHFSHDGLLLMRKQSDLAFVWRADWRAWFKVCCDRYKLMDVYTHKREKVEEICQRFIWEADQGAEDLYQIGLQKISEERIEEAISILTLALQFNPALINAYRQRELCYRKMCNFQKANEDNQKAISLEEGSLQGLSYWANIELIENLAESIIRETAILQLRTLNGHESGVSSVCFSPNNEQKIVSASYDGSLRFAHLGK